MREHHPGSEIAGYRIESVIGRGGMAVVYRAEDTRLGRKVALKLLAPQLGESEQFRARFIRESRLAASLDHPNIVPIYEAGEADDQLFIAMRYVVGNDLKGLLLAQGGHFAPTRTLHLFGQIGDALDVAHRTGLVHRDVKPGNILVAAGRPAHSRSTFSDHVYLTDFGLTKRTSSLSGSLTDTGHFLGTVDYVAPEQIQGKPVGPWTDIYSLGCVLYECLTGELPFRRDDDAATLWAHLVDAPPPASGVRPELPGPVDAVVARAMSKSPSERYESCDQLLRDLEAALPVAVPVHNKVSGSGSARAVADSGSGLEVRPSPGEQAIDIRGATSHPSFPRRAIARASQPVIPVQQPEPADHDGPGPEAADEPAPPPADERGRGRRRRVLVIALAATALVVAGTLAALYLRPGAGAPELARFTSAGTVVPFSLERPATWTVFEGAASDLVLSPRPEAQDLFLLDRADVWTGLRRHIKAGSTDVVGVYAWVGGATIDVSSREALEASLEPLLPKGAVFDTRRWQRRVAGADLAELEATVTDPADPVTSLTMLVDVVQPPEARGSLVLVFFATPDEFDRIRDTVFYPVRDSLTFTPS